MAEVTPIWHYRARCLKVIDGDTLELLIDTGFRTTRTERVRLLGVDTPELRSSDPEERERAQAAKTYVEDWLFPDSTAHFDEWPLLIYSQKGDSFGRWLAEVQRNGSDLASDLIDAGHGVEY